MSETEYVCRFTGQYKLKGDTVILERKILTETDGTYYPVYLIDARDSLLYPVINGMSDTGESHRLTLGLLKHVTDSEGKITVKQ